MWQAALLCGVAGYVDALGYLRLGSVFAANMTGNTVLLAIAAAHGEWARASVYAMTLAAFFVGAVFASFMRRAIPRGAWLALLAQAALLLAASLLPLGAEKELVLLALGMGLQGAAVTQFAGMSLYTVVITATMCRLASSLVDGLWPKAEPNDAPAASAHWPIFVLAWLFYGLGAALEVLLFDGLRLPLLVPALLLALYALLLARRARAGES